MEVEVEDEALIAVEAGAKDVESILLLSSKASQSTSEFPYRATMLLNSPLLQTAPLSPGTRHPAPSPHHPRCQRHDHSCARKPRLWTNNALKATSQKSFTQEEIQRSQTHYIYGLALRQSTREGRAGPPLALALPTTTGKVRGASQRNPTQTHVSHVSQTLLPTEHPLRSIG